MEKRNIYLDNNATTPLHPEVKKAMTAAFEAYGNPSSMHSFGREAKELLDSARKEVASLINASSDEVIFVGSGSEANNTVLSTICCPGSSCMACGSKREILTTKIEHPCILETSRCLHEKGVDVRYLGVDSTGKIDISELEAKINENTTLVSVMMANNEIGTTQDIKKISRIVHDKGAMFHTDAVQAAGKIPVDVIDLDIDFLTLSAHKIYGPKGTGALYIKKGLPFCPLIRGGHQENGRRAGTENTLGIIGFGKAVEMRKKEMKDEEERLLKFKTVLKQGLQERVDDIQFNGHPQDCLPGTLNVSFPGAEGEAILLYLDLEGIAVSTGSACASGSLDPSHVLLATGLGPEKAHGSIRISMGRENTMEDVEYVIEKVPPVIKKIRQMSTAYTKGDANG